MIVWDEDQKFVLGELQVAALKALQVGYTTIRPVHGAVLGTFKFCYAAPGGSGYQITPAGRKALEIWEAGYEYDCATEDRRPEAAPGRGQGAP